MKTDNNSKEIKIMMRKMMIMMVMMEMADDENYKQVVYVSLGTNHNLNCASLLEFVSVNFHQ